MKLQSANIHINLFTSRFYIIIITYSLSLISNVYNDTSSVDI